MPPKLKSRLKVVNWIILGVCILVSCYLLLSAAATQAVSDRAQELMRIEGATNITELKTHASALAMVGDNASHISLVLIRIAVATLLVVGALAGVSTYWLANRYDGIDEKSPDA